MLQVSGSSERVLSTYKGTKSEKMSERSTQKNGWGSRHIKRKKRFCLVIVRRTHYQLNTIVKEGGTAASEWSWRVAICMWWGGVVRRGWVCLAEWPWAYKRHSADLVLMAGQASNYEEVTSLNVRIKKEVEMP